MEKRIKAYLLLRESKQTKWLPEDAPVVHADKRKDARDIPAGIFPSPAHLTYLFPAAILQLIK